MLPPTWARFIIFLQKNLEETRDFVDNIWRKFRNANKYPFEDVIDQTAYMEYFQSILKEFDDVATPIDNVLIWYFKNGLGLSICA